MPGSVFLVHEITIPFLRETLGNDLSDDGLVCPPSHPRRWLNCFKVPLLAGLAAEPAIVRLDFTNYVTNYTYMNAAAKFCRDFLFRVCPIAGS